MGQYYIAIILGPAGEPKEFIRCWVSPYSYSNGAKLMEHSYLGNAYMNAVERLLSPAGPYWKSRLVWAGDYADVEPGYTKQRESTGEEAPINLYQAAHECAECRKEHPEAPWTWEFRYLVNHTRRLVVDKEPIARDVDGSRRFRIHPLSLLTAEGNGRGGGDYHGINEHLVGSWARDVLSVEREAPAGYERLEVDFRE